MSPRRGPGVQALAAVPTAVVAIAFGAGCGGEGANDGPPTTSVTQSGDTTIIVPTLDGPAGRLVSDLIIGDDESNPDALFGQLADAAFGPEGIIYVVDNQASQVSVFDEDGEFLRLLARRGEGPGEVEFPSRIAVADDGRVAVSSFVEIETFSPAGERAMTLTVGARIQDPMRFDRDGHLHLNTGSVRPSRHAPWTVPAGGISGIEVVRGSADFSLELIELDAAGEEIGREPAPFGLADLDCIAPDGAGGGHVCIGFAFGAYPWVDWLPDGRLIRAEAARARLDLRGRDGSERRVSIRPPREREDISGGLRDYIEEGLGALADGGGLLADSVLEVPGQKPAIAGIFPTRVGTIWVRIHADSERSLDDDGEETWVEVESRFDIFTPDGHHAGYVTGPADLMLRDVRGDTVLATRTGLFDVPIVERFIVDWSDPN